MKNSKSVTAALLLSAILFLLLASCGETASAPSSPSGADSQTAAPAAEETTTADPATVYELPDLNFDGQEIHFLTSKNSGYDWYTSKEIYAAEQNGELFNDAVYLRNLTIEEKYGVKITEEKLESAHSAAQKSLMAGDTQYDVVMPYINNTINLAQQGLLYNLYDVPHLDLDKVWWDQRANSDLTINGKLFFTTGDISILDNECTIVMFFNKSMIADYSLDNPYQLVFDKQWTMDNVKKMTLNIASDINGDGQMTNDDLWGISIASNAPFAFYVGCGERIAKNDADGNLQLVMNSERSAGVISSLMELCLSDQVISEHTTKKAGYDDVCKVFLDSRVIFVTFALVDINGLRDAEFEFGILPFPLYNETQDDYNNLISTILVSSVSIPYNCSKLEAVGATLEAMAYYSVDTLTTAYYDNALKTRYMRDEESGVMLDIIFATRVYDLGFIYDWGGIGSLVRNMYGRKTDAFASSYAAIEEKAIAAMNKTIEAFDALK